MKKENKNVEVVTNEVATKPSNKANRIVSIILLVILSLLAIAIVLCTFLPKNFNLGLQEPTMIIVHTSSDETNGVTYEKDTTEYQKIMSLYNKSFESTILGAMFQGKLFSNVTAKEGYKSTNALTSSVYIEFFYDKTQTLKINGQEYNASIVSDTDYIKVVIEVNDSTSLTSFNAYFKYKSTGTNDYSYVRFNSYAIQANLYDYLENL